VQALLERAGIPAAASELVLEPLTGGRTGAAVTRISTAAGAYVVKVLPEQTWRDGAVGRRYGGEGPLWLASVTRDLPRPLTCPIFFVEHRDGEWRLLMRDVSAGIRARGQFDDADERTLVEAIARLHAHWWDRPDLATLDILTVAESTRFWAEPLTALLGGSDGDAAPWARAVLAAFTPMAALVPRFVELAGDDDARFYLALARDRAWLAGLDAGPHTLLHGDLRRANISFESSSQLALIDWELAGRGPAAVDLAYHAFLHFWAYPNRDAEPDDHPELVEHYLDALETELGHAIDRRQFARQWELGWLRAFVVLGYCLADATPAQDELARARCRRAFERARRIYSASQR